MNKASKRWSIERWDATWGGWRKVGTSFDNDSPVVFRLKREAEARAAALRAGSSFKYRVTEADQ